MEKLEERLLRLTRPTVLLPARRPRRRISISLRMQELRVEEESLRRDSLEMKRMLFLADHSSQNSRRKIVYTPPFQFDW